MRFILTLSFSVLSLFAVHLQAAEPIIGVTPLAGEPVLEIKDGERIVLVGSTFVERMQAYNYVELLLHGGLPKKKIAVRNLGWSGDTVRGEARALFGSAKDGLDRLVKDTLATKPTMIFLAYGGNEAHAGKAGLEAFERDLNTLLERLAPAKAKIILVSPHARENLGSPLPNPKAYNEKMEDYAVAMEEIAKKRGLGFLNFTSLLPVEPSSEETALTNNGLHFTAYGYWRLAPAIAKAMGANSPGWTATLDAKEKETSIDGGSLTKATFGVDAVTFQITDDSLPCPAPPKHSPKNAAFQTPGGQLKITNLPEGAYALYVDDKWAQTADHLAWGAGVKVDLPSQQKQLEELREAIRLKNELHFHRYRPQNETYLFLFRKHEQGNNAVEIPQFDPLVEKQDEKINAAKTPTPHRYRLVRVKRP